MNTCPCPACARPISVSPPPPQIVAVRCGCGARSAVEWRGGVPTLTLEPKKGEEQKR